MFYNPADFVNRQSELETFALFMQSSVQRVLVICGEEGMGKSCLLQQFRQHPLVLNRKISILDFRDDPTLAQVLGVIHGLRQQWQGEFDQALGEVELCLQQEFYARQAASVPTQLAQAFAGSGVPMTGNLTLSGSVQAENIVLGTNIVISNSSLVLNPNRGADLVELELNFRRSNAFREALSHLATNQPLLLLVDHYDQANELVKQWLNKNLFALALDYTPTFANLRIVVACQSSPFDPPKMVLSEILVTQKLQPFSYDIVELFWVGKRKLDKLYAQAMAKASGGHPATLVLMANNYARA